MKELKIVITGLLGALTSLFGALAIPMLLLVGCNIIDYATGIVASPYRGQKVSSYKGFRGIAKKVCMWLLVIVGWFIDVLLASASANIGIALPFTFLVSIIVAIWLVCNELLSILENIADIGVPIPSFLTKLVKYIKTQAEKKAEWGGNENGQ